MDGLTIGEVAAQAKVHIETLRNYERRGLIERPPRSVSNYRRYPQSAVGFPVCEDTIELVNRGACPSCQDIIPMMRLDLSSFTSADTRLHAPVTHRS